MAGANYTALIPKYACLVRKFRLQKVEKTPNPGTSKRFSEGVAGANLQCVFSSVRHHFCDDRPDFFSIFYIFESNPSCGGFWQNQKTPSSGADFALLINYGSKRPQIQEPTKSGLSNGIPRCHHLTCSSAAALYLTISTYPINSAE